MWIRYIGSILLLLVAAGVGVSLAFRWQVALFSFPYEWENAFHTDRTQNIYFTRYDQMQTPHETNGRIENRHNDALPRSAHLLNFIHSAAMQSWIKCTSILRCDKLYIRLHLELNEMVRTTIAEVLNSCQRRSRRRLDWENRWHEHCAWAHTKHQINTSH